MGFSWETFFSSFLGLVGCGLALVLLVSADNVPGWTAGMEAPGPSLLQSASGEFDAKTLLKEFLRAQNTELAAVRHRQDSEIRELDASQKARRREWEEKERKNRKDFFASHLDGPERRVYIKDFLSVGKHLISFSKMNAQSVCVLMMCIIKL